MSESQRITNNDIHNSARRVDRYKNFLKRFKNCPDRIKFLDALLLSGRSWIRIATYAYSCQRILEIKDDMPITNVKVDYGNQVKPDLIPIINLGDRIMLSPPDGSDLSQVRVTADNGIDIVEPYRSPANAPLIV